MIKYINKREGALISSFYETMKSMFMNLEEEEFNKILESLGNESGYEIRNGFILNTFRLNKNRKRRRRRK